MDRDFVQPRRIGRRDTDQVLWDQLCRYQRLFRVGQVIASEMDPDRLFRVIREQTDGVMDIERSRVFLHDPGHDRLWSAPSAGAREGEVRLPADSGVPGWVFQNKSPLILNDAYGDDRFDPEADGRTGFITRNILCVPLVAPDGRCIGALEAINKKGSEFDEEDQAVLVALSHYAALAVENSRRCRDLHTASRTAEQRLRDLHQALTPPLDALSHLLAELSEEAESAKSAGPKTILSEARVHLDHLHAIRDRLDASKTGSG